MSSTTTRLPLSSSATPPSVSADSRTGVSSRLPSASGSELPPPTSTGSVSLPSLPPSTSILMSSRSSELPSVTSSPSPIPSSPVPSPTPSSSVPPPVSSRTTPAASSILPSTSTPRITTTMSTPQPTSNPPSTTSRPPTSTSQSPSTTTSQPPPTSTSRPPSTSTLQPPPTSTSQPPPTPTSSQPPPTSTSQPPPTSTSQPPSTTPRPPETTSDPLLTPSAPPEDTNTIFSPTQSSAVTAISTYQSTVFITTTDRHGSTVVSAPSAFTSTLVSTNSMGQPITVTQIINNPTLIPNDGRGGASSFFQNRGAVTGVFIVVGIAATAILVSVFYYFLRKRKERKLDHDTAVAATLEEHGFGRQDLIGPDDVRPTSGPRSMITPTASGSSSNTRRTSSPSMSLTGVNPAPVSAAGLGRQTHNIPYPYYADSFGQTSYNPYMDNQVPYRHTNPGPSDSSRVHNFNLPVTGTGLATFGHGPNDSMGSREPLLGAFSDTEPEPPVPRVPPRNPQRPVGGAGGTTRGGGGRDNRGVLNDESSVYSDDDVAYGGLGRGSLRVRNIPD